jgi:hypothetical protein
MRGAAPLNGEFLVLHPRGGAGTEQLWRLPQPLQKALQILFSAARHLLNRFGVFSFAIFASLRGNLFFGRFLFPFGSCKSCKVT